MFKTVAILIFSALLAFGSGSVFAFQKTVRPANTTGLDSVNSGSGFGSAFYTVDTSKPVQAAFVLSGVDAGTLTISLVGYAGFSGDTWAGAGSYVTLISRGSITSSGRYMLQLSPGANANSSTTYGLLNKVALVVSSDNADSCAVDAYLIYHTPDGE